LRLSRNFGKEAALCAGLEHASGRAVITMDGDLQHPPHAIPEMIRRWRSGEAVIVDGVKLEKSRPRSLAFYAVFRALSGVDLDHASDFKLLDRQAVEAWRAMGDRNLFYRGMAHWLGFRRVQVKFEVYERAAGRSRWSVLRLMRLAAHAVVAFSSVPLQLATALGFAFLVFALLLGAQTLLIKLNGRAVSGFATVIILLLIVGSMVLLSLGVIGQYIAAIYDEVKGRPRYLVAEVTTITTTDQVSAPEG
jgi:glycosyltransferase involved in cell wall biosynthesis